MPAAPTIYDIARRAGVGIATVSRVINGSARVAEPTRRTVQQAMSDLGFRPNRAARRLAVRGANRARVAALMPFFSTNFYFSVARPMALGLAAAGIDLVLHSIETREDKQRLLDRFVAERSAEGVIMCSMGIGAERQEQLARLGMAVVAVDYPLPGVPSVTVDNRRGGRMAAQHLRVAGAKRLGLVSGPVGAIAFRHREDGFVATAGPNAPTARAETVSVEGGRAATRALLDGHPDLDGIVTVNDLLAVGAVEELRARGRRVPDEVQVIGFDDQPLMDVLGLTTVRQPMHAFGEWASRAIQTRIATPEVAVESLQLGLTLIERATTKQIRAGRRRSP